MPTRLQGSASDTPARFSCHLTCYKGRPAPGRTRTNCRQVQHRTNRPLPERFADHALGRGARLTQVQREAGGTWVVGLIEPGGHERERQIKGHDASRYCDVCQAVKGLKAGELTSEQALARAGWDRSSEYQRGLLLEILGIDRASVDLKRVPERTPEPKAVTLRYPKAISVTAEHEALVDALERSWPADPKAPEYELEAG